MVVLSEFYNHVKVKFVEEKPFFTWTQNAWEKHKSKFNKELSRWLDDIVQRLPDEDMFKLDAEIWFCGRNEFIERWEDWMEKNGNYPRIRDLLNVVKNAEKHWQSFADTMMIKSELDIVDAIRTIEEQKIVDIDGFSQPIWNLLKDRFLGMNEYIIAVIIDERYFARPDPELYYKGVICHELVEFSTKIPVLNEHMDEVKKLEDVNIILRKYLKSGFTSGPEYKEHEKIVNKEVIRLGFRKEIEAMDGPQD